MSLRITNGEQGRLFLKASCEICVHDHGWHSVEVGPYKWEERDNRENGGKTCPIQMRSLLNLPVYSWSYGETGNPRCKGFTPDEVCINIREAYESGRRHLERTMGTWVSPYPVVDAVAIHPDQLTIDGVV